MQFVSEKGLYSNRLPVVSAGILPFVVLRHEVDVVERAVVKLGVINEIRIVLVICRIYRRRSHAR